MKIKESSFWKLIILICLLPTIIRFLEPMVIKSRIWLPIQHFAFGTIISIATGATILTKYLKTEGFIDPKTFIVKQKIVAIIGTLILGMILIFMAINNKFQECGGWLLLPVSFIGIVLYLREIIKKKIINNK